MVKIVYMSRRGDDPKTCTLEEAKEVIAQELDKKNLVAVIEPDENTIVTRATNGQITAIDESGQDRLNENSTVGVFRPVAGG